MDTAWVWRDFTDSSNAYIKNPNGGYQVMTVHAPNAYSDVWTAQAEYLDDEFRQTKFSGLLNGGSDRDQAKSAAVVALHRLMRGQ